MSIKKAALMSGFFVSETSTLADRASSLVALRCFQSGLIATTGLASAVHCLQYRPGFFSVMHTMVTLTSSDTLAQTLTRWLYTVLLTLLFPLVYVGLLKRGVRRQRYDNHAPLSRLGWVARPPAEGGYLFHCVSVGEVVAASALIKPLMAREPHTPVTITTTTPTGSAQVRAIFGDSVHHFYLPLDVPLAMHTMLRRVAPKLVLITEVELWPNLIDACARRQLPCVVINARMTARSARRYQKVSWLFTPMLRKLTHVCAQGPDDFKRYVELGMPPARLTQTNNIKFDQAAVPPTGGAPFMALDNTRQPVWVAGSTHEPEEEVILAAYDALHTQYPNLVLVIVPRHPERFDTVAKLLEAQGRRFVRSSTQNQLPEDCRIVLLDEMGRLTQAFQVATLAFVGGSIAQRGGHNALEPAALGLPVVMGPHTYNNPVICQTLADAGALHIVPGAKEMQAVLAGWMDDPKSARRAGDAGAQVVQQNQGAVTASLACIDTILKKKQSHG